MRALFLELARGGLSRLKAGKMPKAFAARVKDV